MLLSSRNKINGANHSQKVVPTSLLSFARNKLMTTSSYIATYYKQPVLTTESDDNLFHNWKQLNKQCKHILITWLQLVCRSVTTCAFVRAQGLFSIRRHCSCKVKTKFSSKKVGSLPIIYGEFSLRANQGGHFIIPSLVKIEPTKLLK